VAPRRVADLALSALLGALACGGSPAGPGSAGPRIDYVDGAIEPLLVAGQAFVIEGFGFGDAPATAGAIRFARAGGGVVAATASAWSDRAIRAAVPDSATTGPLMVTTSDGRTLSATVHVLPRVRFDATRLAWQARPAFPRSPVGVGAAAGTEPSGGGLRVTVYAAGGAEPLGGDSALVADSAVFVARMTPGGAFAGWIRSPDLPAARAFAAVAVANRYNSRFDARALYVIGGLDASGRARATVYQALATADTAIGPFTPIEPLPAPVAGAIAVVSRGRIYVVGGTDSLGRPLASVFVGRVGANGHVDGWYVQPSLPAARAHGGGVALDGRIAVFGGIADRAPPGGGLEPAPPRLAAADTARLSLASGFFVGGWGGAGIVLPEGRSQFATLVLGDVVLIVGGLYGGAAANSAETLAAVVSGGDSLGVFAGPVGTNTIAALGGGTLVGPAGVSWRDADGSHHGLVFGGIDLATRERRDGAWGF
jgi:hypothetical protein